MDYEKALNSALAKGKIDQAKYNEGMDRIRARNLGVSAETSTRPRPAVAKPVSNEPGVLSNLEEPAPVAEVASYQTPAELRRSSAYVPGHGDASTEDGSWWDDIKNSIPAEVRDFTLLPSRGPVWFEPSDEEASGAVSVAAMRLANQTGPGTRSQIEEAMRQQYKDQKWAEAYDLAKKNGEAIYRARDINEKSPSFMQTAKRTATWLSPLEGLVRGADQAILLGAGSAAPIVAERGAREIGAQLGMVPPPGEDTEFLARSQDKLDRERRVMESAPGSEMIGNIAGSLVPVGAAGRLANAASKAFGAGKAVGIAGGVGRGIASGTTGTFVEQMGAQQVQDLENVSAGLEHTPVMDQVKTAGGTSLIAGALSGALNVPSAVSRKMRTGRDADATAYRQLDEAGGGTTSRNWEGLAPPPASDDLGTFTEGGLAGARSLASREGAEDLATRSNVANAQIQDSVVEFSGDLADDVNFANQRVDEVAEGVVSRGERLDRAVDEQLHVFAKKVMDKADNQLTEGAETRRIETANALGDEGAPGYPDQPGPNMYLSEIDEARRLNEAGDSGLETDYPSVSSASIIDKHYDVVQKLSFADGVNIPNTTAGKFKKATDALFKKKTVEPEEASLYEGVAYEIVEREDGMVDVLLPRRLSARELDDFVKAMDEMGKFPNSPAPEAARFREIGKVAAELREEAFPTLAGVKQRQHLEMLQDEEMLRSLGLQRGADKVDSGNIDHTTQVLANLKNIAMTPDNMTPPGLAVPRRQFEKWLINYDEELFNEYLSLRDLMRQKNVTNDFNIMATNAPRSRVASLQTVKSALLGKTEEYDAMVKSFGSVGVEAAAARQEHSRVSGLMKLLGADMNGSTKVDQQKVQLKIHQILSNKNQEEFQMLRQSAKPEQRAVLDVAKQAANDVDNAFTTLGFGAGSGDARGVQWSTSDREQIARGLDDIFSDYNKFDSNVHRNEAIAKVFEKNPLVKQALVRMSGERAFQYLRGQLKQDGKIVFGASRPHGYFVSAQDFFKNHLDALMGRNQTGKVKGVRTPVGAPAEYAMGITSPAVPGDTDSDPVNRMSSTKALEALMAAVELAAGQENAK